MKKLINTLLFAFFVIGCSEGDIIETNVDFDAQVFSCGNANTGNYVFYKIDNATNQVLSFRFNSRTFSLEKTFEDTVMVALNNTNNKLSYRKLTTEVDGKEYFCSSIPPVENNIVQELISENGTANIIYEKVEGTDNDYTRKVELENITLSGDGIALRKELFLLGSETFTATE